MPQFFDYDPVTGITDYFDYDEETGNAVITSVQDIEPYVEAAKQARNSGEIDKGIKESWWHYAIIPPVVELELRKKGINIHDKNCTKQLIKEIDQNYPYLKLTDKTHVQR